MTLFQPNYDNIHFITMIRTVDRVFGFPAGLPAALRSNIIHYYWDIAWWGLYTGSLASFLGIYATRLGATPAQLGLMTALPAGFTLLLALPFAGVVRRMGAYRATWTSAFIGRAPLLVFVVLPFFLDHSSQVIAIISLSLLLAIPNTLIGIAFPHLFIEAVTPEWRSTVVSTRTAILSILGFLITMGCGQILTRISFPTGYQVVFLFGFAGAVITTYHLHTIHPLAPGFANPAEAAPSSPPPPERKSFIHLPSRSGAGAVYIRVLITVCCFNATANMVTPLIPGLLVNKLVLSDGWISLGTALNSLVVFIISMFIARLTVRTGNRTASAIGALLYAVQAIFLYLMFSPFTYLLAVLTGSLGTGVLSTALYNFNLENVPNDDRSTWLSWSSLAGNAGVLTGVLLGPQLAGLISTPNAMLFISAARLFTAVLIYRWH